jgi:hypothetical protein
MDLSSKIPVPDVQVHTSALLKYFNVESKIWQHVRWPKARGEQIIINPLNQWRITALLEMLKKFRKYTIVIWVQHKNTLTFP